MKNYYKKRISDNNDYEESYWGVITDPDGNVRNRIDEEKKFIKNVKNEIDFVNSLEPSKILDIGCGLGFLLGGLDEKHEKFGLELSTFAASHAKKYAEIYNESFETVKLDDNFFDVVIAHHVIEHIEKPEMFLEKVSKILKTDGLFIVATPDFESVCAKLFKDDYRMLSDKTHVSLFSFDSLKAMLTDYGFEIIDLDFPFFDTEYFNEQNIINMLNFDKNKISPGCWGNFMTFYCKNKKCL